MFHRMLGKAFRYLHIGPEAPLSGPLPNISTYSIFYLGDSYRAAGSSGQELRVEHVCVRLLRCVQRGMSVCTSEALCRV